MTAIDREIKAAFDAFSFTDPSAAAPALARALAASRAAHAQLGAADADVGFVLGVKEQQIADAIHAALGISLTATAQPTGTPDATGPFNAGPPAMPAIVPGQKFEVRAVFVNRGRLAVTGPRFGVRGNDSKSDWGIGGLGAPSEAAEPNRPIVRKLSVSVPENATLARPHFSRASIQEARYAVADESQRYRPSAESPLDVTVMYEVNGVPVEIWRPVTRLDPNLPYGYDTRVLQVVPAIALTLTPSNAVVRLNALTKKTRVSVEVLNNREGESEGTLTLKVPAGWKVTPASQPFRFSRAGERALYAFDVGIAALGSQEYRIEAVASSAGREYREGYTTIRHRDLETRYLYRDAVASVRGVDVAIAPGLKVGYVMGVGDDVPSGLAQIGVSVELLGERDLATGNLTRFDAVMTGTRAYAVRDDLRTYNRRLLDYVKGGGNLIVLYNTQEFVPNRYAPYPGTLSAGAEEVSEEDSPIEILAPDATGAQHAEPDHHARFRQLGRAARVEVLERVGCAVHADHCHVGQGAGAAERRMAAREVRQRALHVLRVRVPQAAAVRRAGRVPPARQPALAESSACRAPACSVHAGRALL